MVLVKIRISIGENHGIFDDYDSDGENQLLLLYRPQIRPEAAAH